MATIRNTIDTQFTSRGARRVREETESIGRAQTRLGQQSASAGRSFSAQSTGLGGLVGVYAAAAANVFAISAAFEALNAAAKFQTIIKGTEQLAGAVGTSASTIINDLKSVTDGQLSIVEAARSANIALSAGFGRDQLKGLVEIATKASKTLGRDLQDSVQRITRGVIKLEPELLDELGIFTRLEPAVNEYALQLGKSASQLTAFEKRQAFANGVLKDGTNAFKDITLAGESTQKSFEQLVASFSDLAIQTAALLANALVPLADFLNDSLGNQLILLGAIGTLVFGKLAAAVGVFVTGALTALSTQLNVVAARMAAVSTSATAMAARTSAASAAFVGAGALAGGSKSFGSQFKKDIAAGPLSLGQAQDAQPKLVKALEDEKKERRKIRTLMTQANADQEKLKKRIEQSAARSRALGISVRVVRDQIALAGTGANVLTAGLTRASAAAAALGVGLNFALAAINYIVLAAVALQAGFKFFADIDLFQEVLDIYREFTAESRQQAAGLKEINQLVDMQGSKFKAMADALDDIGIDQEDRTRENITDRLQDSINEAADVGAELAYLQDRISRGAGFGGNTGFLTQGGLLGAIEDAKELRDELNKLNREITILSGNFGDVAAFSRFASFIGKAKEEIEGLSSALSKAFIKGRFELNNFEPDPMSSETKEVATTTSIMGTGGVFRPTSPFFDGSISQDKREGPGDNVIQFAGMENDVRLYTERLSGIYTEGSQIVIKAIDDASDGFNKAEELFAGLAQGNISEENAGKLLGIIVQETELARSELKKAFDAGVFDNFAEQKGQVEAYLTSLANGLEYINGQLRTGVERFIAQEKLFIALNKQFKNVNTFIDESGNTGRINVMTGAIATSEKEQLKFQRENFLLLSNRFELLKKLGSKQRQQFGLESEYKSLQQNLLMIAKNAFQESVKLLLNSKQQISTQKIKTDEMREQLELLKMQNAETVRQSGIRARNAQQQLGLQTGDLRIPGTQGVPIPRNIPGVPAPRGAVLGFNRNARDREDAKRGDLGIASMKQTLSTFDAIISREQRRVKLAEQRVALENEAASIQRGMRMGAVQARADSASSAGSLMVMRAEEAATIIEERSLSTTQEILDGRIAVMKAERDAELASIGGQMAVAAEEFKQAQEVIQERRDALLVEQKNQADAENRRKLRRADNLEIIRAERQQLIARKALEIQKVADEKQAIIARKDIAVKQAIIERKKGILGIDTLQKEFDLLKFKIQADDKFLTRYAQITKDLALALGITFDPGAATPEDPTKDALKFIEKMSGKGGFFEQQRGIITDRAQSKINTAVTVATDDEAARRANQTMLENEFKQLTELNKLKKSMEDAETTFLELEGQKQAEMIAKKLENLDLEDQAVKQAFDEKMGALGIEAAVAKEAYRLAKEAAEFDISQKKRMVQLGKDLAFGISDTLGNAMMKFLTNLQEGKPLIEGIGDLFINMLFDIQQKILKASVIDPITTSVTDSLMGSFGKMAFFGGTPAPLAAGGVVHMAQGGQVNALRDRVPAMLEPGEFVIRKNSAKSIGQSRLSQMNATGAGGMGNVQFNIVNEGAPKQAEQQGSPKIDTDKIVIDVVMRDLAQNGPIRKALRN